MDRPIKKRQSRHRRSGRPKPLILTERHNQIILTVFLYRKLTRSQIQRLIGMKHASPTNRCLRRLYDNRYLDRRFRPTVLGSSEAIYTLGPIGVAIVAGTLSIDAAEVKRRRRNDKTAKNDALDHDLLVNDFRIAITLNLARDSRFSLVRWLEPRDCEYHFEVQKRGTTDKMFLRPDGYFELDDGRDLYAFFVEIDLSTSGHNKLKRKFETYLAFQRRGFYQRAFDKKFFYVLVIAKTKTRAANLKKTTGQLESDQFWFTSTEEAQDHPLTSNIWMRSGRKVAGPLFRLRSKENTR